jgi:hypothetical protein
MSDNLSIVLSILLAGLVILGGAASCTKQSIINTENDTERMQTCVEAGKDWQYLTNTGKYQCVGGR